ADGDALCDLTRAAPEMVLDLEAYVDDTFGVEVGGLLAHARDRERAGAAHRVREGGDLGGADLPVVLRACREYAGADQEAAREEADAREREELGDAELRECGGGHSPS